jgi:hypothetical protein
MRGGFVEFGKVVMAGVMAGLIVGIISSLIILVLETGGFLINTVGTVCFCLTPFTCLIGTALNIFVFAIAGIASLVAGVYAAKRIAAFSVPEDMLVGGGVSGLASGIMVALGATIVTIIYPIVSAIIQFLIQLMGFAGAQKKDILSLIIGVGWNAIVMGVGWIIFATIVFFVAGIILGLVGGLIGSFIFKASGASK